MIYLFDSELPKNKILVHALVNIYGINKANAFLICKKLGFSKNLVVKDLSKEQISKLIKNIELSNLIVSDDLLKFRLFIAKRLISIKCYRGLRRYKGLPVRGQRTHTNARTARKKFK